MSYTPQYVDENGRYYVLMDDEAGHQLLDSFLLAAYATKADLRLAIEGRWVHFADQMRARSTSASGLRLADVAGDLAVAVRTPAAPVI